MCTCVRPCLALDRVVQVLGARWRVFVPVQATCLLRACLLGPLGCVVL